MKSRTAVVVEDDPQTSDLIVEVLRRSGFEVTPARTAAEALSAVRSTLPDLVTAEIRLCDMDGIELCRQVRASSRCYVVMISAQDGEVDRLMSLEVGADDFLSKPFSPRELQARVGALFRRPRTFAGIPAQAGPGSDRLASTPAEAGRRPAVPAQRRADLEVDQRARLVRVGDQVVELTRTEFDLLAHLARRPGVVVGRDELLREIWESEFLPESTHLVDVHLANVRRKLRDSGGRDWIRTVRGVGLRFDPV